MSFLQGTIKNYNHIKQTTCISYNPISPLNNYEFIVQIKRSPKIAYKLY